MLALGVIVFILFIQLLLVVLSVFFYVAENSRSYVYI